MKWGCIAVALLSLLAAGCIARAPESIVILNDSGEQIVATSGEDVEAVLNGKSAEMPAAGGNLVIETTKCKFEYALPQNSSALQNDHDHRLGLQMEASGKLYALAATATLPARIADLESLQADGFPLAPQNTSCH